MPPYKAMLGLTVCLVGIYFALVSTGFGPYLTDSHPFRQTQTAITARYFSGFGDFLTYQTPILGLPWSIPFEFPLYQALAKGLHVASGLSLESSGRLVSIAFFLLCFWPLHCLLRAWQVRNTPLVMAAVLLAPLYVFWSRAFMIETTALFFALSYLALFMRAVKSAHGGAAEFLLLTVAGVLAALTKITTVLPLLLVTGGVTAWLALRAMQRREALAGPLKLALAQTVIVVVALAWIAHTDAVKLLNPWGPQLTSSALRRWNFGPLSQRVDPMIWFALANNTVDMFFPFPRTLAWLKGLLTFGWVTLFVYFLSRCAPVRRRQALLLCGLFLLPFGLFTNLHRIHDYYQVANGWLLCLAFGLAACGAIEVAPDARRMKRALGLYVMALLVFGLNSLWYLHFMSTYRGTLVDLSAQVQRMSTPDSVIVISGLDWSAVLPYQASRRALMLPVWTPPTTIATALARLRASGLTVSLYVACGKSTVLDVQVREALPLRDQLPLARSDDCAIYQF